MSEHWRIIDINELQWENLLQDKGIFREPDIQLMLALYNSNCCTERASVLAKKLNVSNYRVLNNQIGLLGKRIVNKLPNIKYPTIFDESPFTNHIDENVPIQYTYIPFEGEDDDNNPGHFYWILRPELENALKKLIDIDVINNDETNASEIPNNQDQSLCEGAVKQIKVNSYERNRKARNICIKAYGYKCFVCDFDFEKKYGII